MPFPLSPSLLISLWWSLLLSSRVGVWLVDRWSDRTQNRFAHCFWLTLVSSGMFAILAFVVPDRESSGASLPVQMLVITLAASAMWGSKPVLFAWASNTLGGVGMHLPVSIAIVIAVGNGGGTAGPYIMAASKTSYGSYSAGIAVIALCEACFAVCLVWIRYELKRLAKLKAEQNAAVEAGTHTVAGLYTEAARQGVAGAGEAADTAQ